MESKVPDGELVDKTTERNFKTMVNYMGNPRLLLAPMFLLLPVIREISDPPSQSLVNPRDPQAKIHDLKIRFTLCSLIDTLSRDF